MTFVRRKRYERTLRLSLPPPLPQSDFQHRIDLPSALSVISPDSPVIDNLSEFERLEVLGHGNGGTVYKARHKRTASIFALKILRFDHNATPARQQAVTREVEILNCVSSPYIVQCHAVFYNDDDLCIAMELMERGSLCDVLLIRKVLPEALISSVARRVLQGLQYLHGMQIVHGDIKPSNLLVNVRGELKIADFGVSRVVVVGRHSSSNDDDLFMGTCAYMSPERFDPERWGSNGNDEHDDTSDHDVGFAGDVWSLGVVVLECLVGHFPLIGVGEKPDWAALVCAICFGERLELPETSSQELRGFITRCLEKDWRKRGTVDEMLHHPFVNSFNCSESMQRQVDFA